MLATARKLAIAALVAALAIAGAGSASPVALSAPATSECDPGDPNGDGRIDAGDISCEILIIFGNQSCRATCASHEERIAALETRANGVPVCPGCCLGAQAGCASMGCRPLPGYEAYPDQLDWSGRYFAGAYLPGSVWFDINLTAANFSGAQLQGAAMQATQHDASPYPGKLTLARADLTSVRGPVQVALADLGNPPDCWLKSSDFIDMTDANLSGAQLQAYAGPPHGSSYLIGVDASRSQFLAADLTAAVFWCADLTGANLKFARIDATGLVGVTFADATLLGATGTPDQLQEIKWSNTTCPDGTNSDANGGTCEGHWLP